MRHLKQEFDKLTFKEVIIYILAVITMLAGLTLLFMGMFIPPEGEIHGSVLTAFGSVLWHHSWVFHCITPMNLTNSRMMFRNNWKKSYSKNSDE